ncbi:MAG: isopentenyl-diphosphate Delta-isomerase [Planctomycetota bacterium]
MDRPQPTRAQEEVILVDADDRPVGTCERALAHAKGGRRHRAFSVYLFDSAGRLLLQQRGAQKPLWPGFWSNSCCSHPRPGEDVDAAAHRRVREELGLTATLTPLFRYEYCSDYAALGTEHEVVHVYIGQADPAAVRANPDEVAAWRMIECAELEREITDATRYTPWFQLAWPRARDGQRARAGRDGAAD